MLKMGILGLGKMGAYHAAWMTPANGMQLEAIYERKEPRAAELRQQYGVPTYTDLEQFLSLPDLDFVVTVTTHEVHEEHAIKALNHGKHVIVEKPMTMTYASAQRMIAAAERNGRHLLVHQSSRWDRDFLYVKDALQSGLLGRPLLIRSSVMLCDEGWPSWGLEGMTNPWRIKAEYGGGMLFDWGSHLVDQALLLAGQDPLGVWGTLQKGFWSDEVDDYFCADLKFASDLVCQVEAGNNGRISAPRWYLCGTRGTLEVKGKAEPFWDEIEMVIERENGKREVQHTKLVGVKESGIEGGFYEDLVPFLEGKKPLVSMYEAAKVVRVLEMIATSSAERRFVPLRE